MTLEYREARLEDAEAMSRLVLELGYDGDEASVRRRLERILALTDHVVFVALERPHGVQGMIHAAVEISVVAPVRVDVRALVVTSEQRESGIGRGLLERVQGWSLRRGIDDVITALQRHRKAGHLFLSKMGYAVTHEHLIYERDLAAPHKPGMPTKMD